MPAHTGSAFKHALPLSTRHAHPTAARGHAPGALAGGFGVPRPSPRLRPISARRRLRTAAAAAAWREKTSLRAATLSSARMREASGSRCSANVSARAMRVRSRGCRSGGARNMAAAGAWSCRCVSASESHVCRCTEKIVGACRGQGEGWLRHGRFFVSGEGTRVARCQGETARTERAPVDGHCAVRSSWCQVISRWRFLLCYEMRRFSRSDRDRV